MVIIRSSKNKISAKQILLYIVSFCVLVAVCTAAVIFIRENAVSQSGNTEQKNSNNETIDTPDTKYAEVSEYEDVSSVITSYYNTMSEKEKTNTSSKTVNSNSVSDSESKTSRINSVLTSSSSTDSDSFEYVNKDMVDFYEENSAPTPAVIYVPEASKTESDNFTDFESMGTMQSSEVYGENSAVESTEEYENNTSEYSETDTDETNTYYPSEFIMLDVPYYSQREDMPTGCELVSAKTVLAYLGHTVTNQDIMNNLTRCDLGVDGYGRLYGKSPFEAFIGDPRHYTGFGCYPPVIENMVDSMGFGDITVCNTSSQPLDVIAETYLTQGFPVMVWVTIGLVDSYWGDSWYLTDENGNVTDEKYTWRAQEHCMVLVGYDENYYYFNDPLGASGASGYDKALVEKRYNEMGCYSLVLRNDR